MARKKGIVKQLTNYGEKHPYVTLALAGTFGYYLYENMLKEKLQPTGPNMYRNPAGLGVTKLVSQEEEEEEEIAYPHMKVTKLSGLGMTTSTSTTTSSSHIPSIRGGETGETSMHIPEGSGLFGVKSNPPAHLMFESAQELSGFSPSARRRVGHARTSTNLGYSPKLDTQFENREAMIMGDLRKNKDILGFSGLMPLQGGDWYE